MTLHVAARLLDLAPSGGTVVSGAAAQAAAGAGLLLRPMGEHELRGVPGRWTVFRLGDGAEAP